MQINLINRGTTGELLINGRLDSVTSPQLEKLADGLVPRFDTIIFDLSGLEYTSSAGLRIFLKMHNAMLKKGGSFRVTGAGPAIMEVLELTGLGGILSFIP